MFIIFTNVCVTDEDYDDEDEENDSGDKVPETTTSPPPTEQHARRDLHLISQTNGIDQQQKQKSKAEKSKEDKKRLVISMNKDKPKKPTVEPLHEADQIILTNFTDDLLKNKQIVVLDRNQKKNEQFLKAIQDVMREFAKMYEIPSNQQEGIEADKESEEVDDDTDDDENHSLANNNNNKGNGEDDNEIANNSGTVN